MSKRWRTGVEAEITCKQYVLSVQRPPRPWANDQDKTFKVSRSNLLLRWILSRKKLTDPVRDLPLSFHVQHSNTGINQIEEEKNVLVILVVLFPNCHSGPHGMRLVWFQDRPDHRPACLSQRHATNHGGTQKEQARDIGTRVSWGEWFQTNPY